MRVSLAVVGIASCLTACSDSTKKGNAADLAIPPDMVSGSNDVDLHGAPDLATTADLAATELAATDLTSDPNADMTDPQTGVFRIANTGDSGPALIDVCIRETGGAYTMPLMKSLGFAGVPKRSISQKLTITSFTTVKADVRVIDATVGDCAIAIDSGAADIANVTLFLGNRIYFYLNSTSGGAIASVRNDTGAVVPGKQVLLNGNIEPPANLTYGSSIISGFAASEIDPQTATMTAAFAGDVTVTRDFTAVASEVTTVLPYTDAIVVCLDSGAPTSEGLTPCGELVNN